MCNCLKEVNKKYKEFTGDKYAGIYVTYIVGTGEEGLIWIQLSRAVL